MQALDVKRKRVVEIGALTETGAIANYYPVNEPGNWYMPLIVDGKNVEEFRIINEQLSILDAIKEG